MGDSENLIAVAIFLLASGLITLQEQSDINRPYLAPIRHLIPIQIAINGSVSIQIRPKAELQAPYLAAECLWGR